MTAKSDRRRSAIWLVIGLVAAVGILGNIGIAIWLLNRTI